LDVSRPSGGGSVGGDGSPVAPAAGAAVGAAVGALAVTSTGTAPAGDS